jgi:hypothetical protein
MTTGCATALRGEDAASFDLGADPVAVGHVLESFVFCELETSQTATFAWRQGRALPLADCRHGHANHIKKDTSVTSFLT